MSHLGLADLVHPRAQPYVRHTVFTRMITLTPDLPPLRLDLLLSKTRSHTIPKELLTMIHLNPSDFFTGDHPFPECAAHWIALHEGAYPLLFE